MFLLRSRRAGGARTTRLGTPLACETRYIVILFILLLYTYSLLNYTSFIYPISLAIELLLLLLV
jgi:hypothetical protein